MESDNVRLFQVIVKVNAAVELRVCSLVSELGITGQSVTLKLAC